MKFKLSVISSVLLLCFIAYDALAVDRTPVRYIPFRCRNGVSVSRTFRCDSYAHCTDGSDEEGCLAPSILEQPPELVSVSIGKNLTLTCRGAGVPPPTVEWKMNGKQLDGLCDWTSIDGDGRLTCPVRIIDTGNYSCHLKNPKGTIDVLPVTRVSVLGNPCPVGYFQESGIEGRCLRCFCSGVSTLCQLGSGFYRWNYTMAMDDWKMQYATWDGKENINLLPADGLNRLPIAQPLFYSLPFRFIEYQVLSYGGFLQYEIFTTDTTRFGDYPDVVLKGYNITLIYRNGQPLKPNTTNHVAIKLWEHSFQKLNGGQIDRIEFMTVLAYIDRFLIKMYPRGNVYEPAGTDVVMDSASSWDRGMGKATSVEECRCPSGYRETSCERCDFGYNRALQVGISTGLCMPWEWHREQYARVSTSTTRRRYHYV